MVAKVRGPINQIPDGSSESESDLDYDNDEVSNISEAYDDHELDQQILRQRHKRSSVSFTDSEILSST